MRQSFISLCNGSTKGLIRLVTIVSKYDSMRRQGIKKLDHFYTNISPKFILCLDYELSL